MAPISDIRQRASSIRAEQISTQWLCRCSAHFDLEHPHQLGAAAVTPFPVHLAVKGNPMFLTVD